MSKIQNNITSLQSLLEAVNALPEAGGVELPELQNEGSTEDLMLNKELIDADGNKITGTFTIDSELSTQDDLIAQIQVAVDSLPEAGGGEPTLQSKIVTPSTSSQTVTADSGYDGLNIVTVNPIPSTYVKPTSTKAATTYTPTTSNQTIPAGTYCADVQTIKGDSNLIPANIVSGKSIFGVAGSAEVGSGGNSFPYTITINNNMGLSSSIFYNNDNTNVLVVTTGGALGQPSHKITGGTIRDFAISPSFLYYYITSITDNVILNLTFHNPYE